MFSTTSLLHNKQRIGYLWSLNGLEVQGLPGAGDVQKQCKTELGQLNFWDLWKKNQ